MNIRLCILAVLMFGFCAAEGRAQQLSVDEAVRQGLEHNTRVRAAHADAAAADADRRAARASLLPSIETRASYLRLSDNIPGADFTFPGSDTTFTLLPVELNRYHTEISVEQPLWAGGRIAAQARAARLQRDAAALQTRQVEADVAFEIRQAYWRLYESDALLEAIDASLSHIEAHVGEVEAGVQEGIHLQADLLAARVRRSEILLDRIDAEIAAEFARLELNRLIGRPLDTDVEPASDFEEGAAASLATLQMEVLDAHPSIEALERRVEALETLHSSTRGAWLPEISAVGRLVYARPNTYFFLEQDEFRYSWEAGVSARWSLFEGGRRSAETARARAELTSAEARLDELREQVDVHLSRRHLETRRAGRSADVAAEAVEAAAEALRVTRVHFREGLVLASDVLEAEQVYHNARVRLARATAERALASAALLNAVGRVW